ncbi:MAG: hypothetical protein WAO82_01275 [Limnohabitans sp.]
MDTPYKILEQLANNVANAHAELKSEIEKICDEDGVSEEQHPLHHSAQNILRIERQLGELVKAMLNEQGNGEKFKNDLKNIYMQQVIADDNFKFTGFARVLIHAGLNKASK